VLLGKLDLVLPPPDKAAAGREEQDDRQHNPLGILPGRVAQLVAPQVLVDLAQEGFVYLWGLRQRCFSPLRWGSSMPVASFPTLDERKLAAHRLAVVARNAKAFNLQIDPTC